MKLRTVFAAAVAVGMLAVAGCAGASDPEGGEGAVPVRMSLNYGLYAYLPIHLAIEKGYFEDEGIDLQVSPLQGSSASLLPLVARGDLDITPVVAAPALFNAFAEGFEAKLIASINSPMEGWGENGYLMVRQDLWDSGAVTDVEDLDGMKLDGGPAGSPMNLVSRVAMEEAGLDSSDVTFTENLGTPADQLAALQNKAVDVVAVSEMAASQFEADGVAHKWIGLSEVVPWAQLSMFAANETFLAENPETVEGFLRAYLKAAQEVTDNGPQWNDEFLDIVAAASDTDKELIKAVGAPEWVGSLGVIDIDFLQRSQDFWVEAGQVKTPVDPQEMVDTEALRAAEE